MSCLKGYKTSKEIAENLHKNTEICNKCNNYTYQGGIMICKLINGDYEKTTKEVKR